LRINHAHKFLSEVITAEDLVVDGTMGNGHDTELLAKLSNKVFAFDVQDKAISATRERLKTNGLSATLVKDGHENIDKHINEPIKAAIFNLGYLPGSDKKVVTKPVTTIKALEVVCGLLVKGGRIAVTVYPGHEGGKTESEAVMKFVSGLDKQRWQVNVHHSEYKTDSSPYILRIQKL
jgi:tRNA G37 N-methylase Trm5